METPDKQSRLKSLVEVFTASLKLGLTSFGGPIAHLGYYYDEYVRRRRWLDDDAYAELTALCQLLPGPASSQFGIAVGTMRAGLPGGIASWIGFTLPSALIMLGFGLFMKATVIDPDIGWLHGLKIVAVAIVAQAVVLMGEKLAADRVRATIALASAAVALLWTMAAGHIVIIVAAGIAGTILFWNGNNNGGMGLPRILGMRTAAVSLTLLLALLVLLPLVRHLSGNILVSLADGFYRAGSLVFGGGHVILPLLEREVVPPGWLTDADFLAGYGAAQAVPGPLFTFSAYLGVLVGGIPGSAIALVAIFLPGFFLIWGALPLWGKIRSFPAVRGAVSGINAAVVGILLAALYHPLWTTSIKGPGDFALAAALYGMLAFWKLPPWLVVIVGAGMGMAMSFMAVP